MAAACRRISHFLRNIRGEADCFGISNRAPDIKNVLVEGSQSGLNAMHSTGCLHNLIVVRAEGSHSGLVRTLGKRVNREVPRVRIPHPPLC